MHERDDVLSLYGENDIIEIDDEGENEDGVDFKRNASNGKRILVKTVKDSVFGCFWRK